MGDGAARRRSALRGAQPCRVMTHHNKSCFFQNVKCTKCDQVFKRTTTSSFWKKHWSTCKGEKRWKFTCEKCQYVFSKRQSYVKHIQEKICEKKPVKKTVPSHCQVCTELFDSKQALRQHIVERHPEIKMFKCEKCPLIFPTFSYLR